MDPTGVKSGGDHPSCSLTSHPTQIATYLRHLCLQHDHIAFLNHAATLLALLISLVNASIGAPVALVVALPLLVAVRALSDNGFLYAEPVPSPLLNPTSFMWTDILLLTVLPSRPHDGRILRSRYVVAHFTLFLAVVIVIVETSSALKWLLSVMLIGTLYRDLAHTAYVHASRSTL
jgi:hypothetical protein